MAVVRDGRRSLGIFTVKKFPSKLNYGKTGCKCYLPRMCEEKITRWMITFFKSLMVFSFDIFCIKQFRFRREDKINILHILETVRCLLTFESPSTSHESQAEERGVRKFICVAGKWKPRLANSQKNRPLTEEAPWSLTLTRGDGAAGLSHFSLCSVVFCAL